MASLLNMSGGSLLKKGLPYDAEVEYLESSGTQIINTGVYGTESLKTELCVKELSREYSVAVFGNFTTDRCYYLYQGGSTRCWQVGFCGWDNTTVGTDTNKHTFLFDNFNVYIDGVLMNAFNHGSFTTSKELWLFNISGSINYRSVAKRVYYCNMWDNGTLIRDFIPVRVGQVGYMYDKVSGQLFGNAGTGEFILGPDKTN